MKKQKKGLGSLVVTVGGGILVFALVVAFLSGLRSTKQIVVAKQALPAGARLTADYLELREVHTSDVMPNALTAIEDADGQVLTVARVSGDQITIDMVGSQATVGIANQLSPGHRAVAVHVNQASGLVGILRPGDRVAVVAIVDPQAAQMQQQQQMYSPATVPTTIPLTGEEAEQATEEEIIPREPPGPASYIVVSGLHVLLVPQLFRYEETLPTEDNSGGFAPARTSLSAQQQGVVLLDVPTQPVEIADTEGVEMSPAALLPLLDANADLYLLLEPPGGDDGITVAAGANLADLYRAITGMDLPMDDLPTAANIGQGE